MSAASNTITDSVKEYGKRLFAFIRGRVHSDEDAEDILQDVWYQFSNTSEIIDQAGAWLYRVARNRIIDGYRKKQPQSLEDFTAGEEEFDPGFKEILLADSNNPEIEYLKNLFWDQLYKGLEELPAEQRDVFVQNELEGKTFAAIAAEKGENIKTLISRKGYAVKHLRKRLQDLYDDFMNY